MDSKYLIWSYPHMKKDETRGYLVNLYRGTIHHTYSKPLGNFTGNKL